MESAKVLGRYLTYARSGGEKLGDLGATDTPLNPFEIHMRDRLLAAPHPTKPGLMILAIEAGGASYHGSETARARDRLRQEHLERLGWRFCRAWSTDYFRDPDAQIQRVKAAYDKVVLEHDRETTKPKLFSSNSNAGFVMGPVPKSSARRNGSCPVCAGC